MELMTSAQANKLLRKLNDEKSALLTEQSEGMTYQAATVEDPEKLRPDYNYSETQKKLFDINEKIRKLKHSINIFNSTTVIPEFNMTIDEMLIYIPQLTQIKENLGRMRNMPEKRRAPQMRAQNFIDYVYRNFPIEQVREDYNSISGRLSAAQIALDTINNSITFEIEL